MWVDGRVRRLPLPSLCYLNRHRALSNFMHLEGCCYSAHCLQLYPWYAHLNSPSLSSVSDSHTPLRRSMFCVGLSGRRHFQTDDDQQLVTWQVCVRRPHCMDSCSAGRQPILSSCEFDPTESSGVPWRRPHCRSGLATLPSVGAVPQSPHIIVD